MLANFKSTLANDARIRTGLIILYIMIVLGLSATARASSGMLIISGVPVAQVQNKSEESFVFVVKNKEQPVLMLQSSQDPLPRNCMESTAAPL